MLHTHKSAKSPLASINPASGKQQPRRTRTLPHLGGGGGKEGTTVFELEFSDRATLAKAGMGAWGRWRLRRVGWAGRRVARGGEGEGGDDCIMKVKLKTDLGPTNSCNRVQDDVLAGMGLGIGEEMNQRLSAPKQKMGAGDSISCIRAFWHCRLGGWYMSFHPSWNPFECVPSQGMWDGGRAVLGGKGEGWENRTRRNRG